MHPNKHKQRERIRKHGRHVHRLGRGYMKVGLYNADGTREQGYWLLKSRRNESLFYNADWTPRE